MQYQEFIQNYPKVISFDLDQNITKSNTKISLINDKVNNHEDSESTMPALIVGMLVIIALAYIIGLVFLLTNLIVKVIIKAYQDTQNLSHY